MKSITCNKKSKKTIHKKYRRLGDIWGRLAIKKRDNFITNLVYEHTSRTFYTQLKKQPFTTQKKYRKNFRPKKNIKKIFAFQAHIKTKQRRKKRFSARGNLLLTRRTLSMFYGGGRIRQKTFRRLAKKINEYSVFKKDKNSTYQLNAYTNYTSKLESRLDVLLLRASFVDSIFVARHYVRDHKTWVQNKGNKIRYPGYLISNFQCFGLANSYLISLRRNLLNKTKKSTILVLPKHLFINFPLLLAFKTETPHHLYISYPFHTNIGTVASFRKAYQLL